MQIWNIKNYGLLAVCVLSLGSCSKMLDMPSKTAYESDVIFNSKGRAEAAILGIYPTLKGTHMVTYMTPDNDETYSTNSSGERYGLSKYSFSAGSGQMKTPFNNRYDGINRANECIDGLEKAGVLNSGTPADQAFFNALYGEALTLRAISYFDLVRYWGDVPFKTSPSKAGDDFNLPRTSRDTIYDHIIKDLQLAETLVPWASEVSYKERITKGAVKGFLARIALHAAGFSLRWDLETKTNVGMRQRTDAARITELYTIARKACQDVMEQEGVQHGLVDNYASLFIDLHNKRYNKENIFELGNYGTSANDGIGYYIGLSVGSGLSAYLPSGPQVKVLPTYYLSFDQADIRRDVSCANFAITKTTGNFDIVAMQNLTCGKWRKCWQDNQGPENGKTNINWVLLRYADILLMFAEADNELGATPSEQAKDALKKVRARAFDPADRQEKVEDYVNGLTTKDAFREALIKERTWELGEESNLRRTDLIRWNRLATTIADVHSKLTTLATEKIDPYTGESIPKYRVYQQKVWAPGAEPVAVPFTWSDVNTGLPAGYLAVEFAPVKNLNSLNTAFAKEFEINRTELMPLPQELIDSDEALKNGQHPGY